MASSSPRASRARPLAILAVGSILAVAAFAPAALATASNGSIWTTAGNCASPNPQDQNEYNTGDPVVIRGSGFDANQAGTWAITGQPGNASTDPGQVVASGSVTADGSGNFCVEAYTVQVGDDGTYTVDAMGKNDNYHVNVVTPSPSPSPSPTPSPTPVATPTPTPSGGLQGETAAASLPPTDSAGSTGSAGALGLVLMMLAGVLAAVMVLTPARATRRR